MKNMTTYTTTAVLKIIFFSNSRVISHLSLGLHRLKVDFYYITFVNPGILQKQTSVNWIHRYSRLTSEERFLCLIRQFSLGALWWRNFYDVLQEVKWSITSGDQLWVERYLTQLNYWPTLSTGWADSSIIWGLVILPDASLSFIGNSNPSTKLLLFFWLIHHCSLCSI